MNTPDCAGHFSRLRERYAKGGIDSFHDHEILELLLTFVLRRDTKPLAKDLLRRFRTVSGVLNADLQSLVHVPGIGVRAATLLSLVRDTGAFCLKERIRRQGVVAHKEEVLEYLRLNFGSRQDEHVAVLFLDNSSKVISSEVVSEGIVNQCAIYPRKIVGQALRHGAACIIMAHNHPGGGLLPSEADWDITKRMFEVGKLLEMPLMDHLIVSREGVRSMREMARWPR